MPPAPLITLITGANTGLGYQIVRSLLRSSTPEKAYIILAGGRSLSKAAAAVASAKAEFPDSKSSVEPIQIDIEDDTSITAVVEQIKSKYRRLDVLINNAGASLDHSFVDGTLTNREMWNKTLSANITSTYLMTYKSVPLLLASPASRIIFITSGTSTLEGTSNVALPFNHSPPAGWPKPNLQLPAYRSSKTGMNMMVLEWRRILRADSVKIVCVSPGYLATGLGKGLEYNKKMGAIDPEIGAEFVRDCVEGQRDADAEKGIVNKSGMQPW